MRHDGGMNEATSPQAIDLLIEAGHIVPVVPHGVVLEDHAVAIDKGVTVSYTHLDVYKRQCSTCMPTASTGTS